METELVRIIADALAHADFGVGAVLPLVPVVSGDSAPPTPTIYDETRHDWVALEELPEEFDLVAKGVTLPALAVTMGPGVSGMDPARAQPSSGALSQAEFEAALNIHYFTADSDAVSAKRAARATMRAVRGTLNVLFHPSHAALRTMNKVTIETLQAVEAVSMFTPLEHHSIAGACAVRLRGRELVTGFTP